MKVRILLLTTSRRLQTLLKACSLPSLTSSARVTNGEALFAAALDLNPDVIITDISMPILNGIEVVRKVRQVGSRAEVMFLTIHSGADFVRLWLAVGANG
jgi:two-component system response regulator YesN